MIEIYVNDRLVDLPKSNLDLGIDYAIFDVNSIGNRQGVRSYSLELPLTNNNKQIFESAEMITNTGSLPYTKIKARILVDGIDINIRLCTLKTVGKYFTVELYGGNTDFFYDTKELSLTELDWFEYNHYWTFDNVLNSRTNSEGYIYPIINYGNGDDCMLNSVRQTDVGKMLPSVFVDTIIEKVAIKTGYTIVNELNNDPTYEANSLILPAIGQAKKGLIDFKRRYEFSSLSGSDKPLYFGTQNYIGIDTIQEYNGNYYQFPYNMFLPLVGIPVTGFMLQDKVTFKVDLNFTIVNTYGSALNATVRIFSITDLLPTDIQTVVVNTGTNNYQLQFEYSNTVEADRLCFIIDCNLSGYLTLKAGAEIIVYDVELVEEKTIYYTNSLQGFDTFVELQQYLPDISVATFFKNYFQMYGIIPVINYDTNTIHLVKFDSIKENISGALDWSNKIDLTEYSSISFLSDNYAQNNVFEYTKDGDETKPTGTDGVIKINNSNLEDEKVIVSLDFSPTITETKLIGIDVDKIAVIGGNYYTYYEDKNSRILLLDYRSNTTFANTSLLTYTDGIDSATISYFPLTRFISLDREYNLGFENNLLNLYYTSIAGIINSAKTLSLQLRLNSVDINQLDFTIPIYLQQYESYFYINKIEGYSPNSNTSCSVELVKLNL